MVGERMGSKPAKTLLAVVGLLMAAGAASASTVQPYAVPEAATYVLAPMGIATIIVAELRRRRVSRLRRGVGLAYFLVKRTFDVLISLLALLASSPVFCFIALLVRASGPGPIIFRRRVIGKCGKSFDMFKFRTMVDRAEELLERDEDLKRQYAANWKLESDPRVTRLGCYLRKLSLDELPQLINVLLGNMTFVGPRPIHADEIAIYGPSVERFKTVTPGITGLWQSCGRSNTSYEARVQMDMLYIEKRCIMLDLLIILRTIPAGPFSRGAC